MMVVMEFVEGGSLSSHLEKIKVSHCSCMPVGD